MARKKQTEGVRVLTCERTGKKFEYSGRGRPPKYCPEARADVLKEQRAAAAKRKKPSKRAAKAAADLDSLVAA